MKPLKPTNTENSEFKLLFSTTKMSPMVKLAIVSVDSNMIPKYIAIVIFILSQVQIMSIFLKTGLECYSNSSLALSKSFTTIHNAISVGDALDFTGSFNLSVFIIALAYSYLLAGVILLMYLLRDMYRGKTHSKVAQRIWGTGAYLHILLFFYPIHSITLKAISVSFAQDEQQVFRNQQAWTFIQVSACLALIANLFFAIVVLIYLLPPVKTGFALSTKTKKFSILDISLKFILPLIWMLDFKSKSLNIFLIVVNFIFCLLRDGLFFRILPYYDTRVLRVAAKVHAAQTLFALVIVIAEGLSKAHFFESLLVVLTLWVMVTPIIVKNYSSCMKSIFRRILFTASGSINPYYLAHYWLIYKDLAKNRTELKIEAKKCDKNYLYYKTALEKVIHKSITTSRREEDLHWSRVILQNKDDIFASENCVLSLGINFLRSSLQKNPLSILQRLALASLYLKYQHSYQTANQIIQQGLERSPSFTKSVSFSLVLLKLIRKLRLVKASSGASEGKGMSKANISIEEYLSLHQKFEKIKEDIQHQLEPQIKFWKNFQLAHIDLDSFLHLAKVTSERSKRVSRYIKNHRDFVGHNFVEPILTLGLYLSFVQHDSLGGSKLMKEYDLRKTKPKDHHKDGVDNDMLHSDSMYFVVSASFHDLGKILNYSNNANQIFSIHKEAIVGKSINVFAPNIYRNDYDHILGVSLKEDIFVSLCKPREIPVLDRHGNLILCWISITLEFLPKTGLSYCILLRPADVSNRGLLIKQNGVIMHSSEQFTEDMGIVKTDKKDALNIFTFCPQLAVLTRAFQHMSTQKDSLKKLDRGERKTQEGNTSSITETIEKEEMKDTINGKDNDFQRLYEKFTNGENLIFSPSTTKKREISPSIAGIDDKDDLSAMPVVYRTIIQTHSVGNEKIYEVKLQQMLNANVAIVWANQDPALKGQGLKTFASFQMIANTLNSLKNKVRSPFSGFSAKYGKPSKNLLTKASIYGEDVQSEAEEKSEFKRAVLVTKTETTPNILLNSMANSCDLRESDQELAANEPLYKHDGDITPGMKTQANREAEEDTIDEELKMKIIKLGIFKRHNKNKGKLFDTVKEAQNHRSLFKIASDILINFKGPNLKKILAGMNQNNNPAPIDDASSVSGKSRVQRAEKTIQRILQSRNYSKYSICYLLYFLLTKIGLLLTVFWFSFDTLIVSNRVKTVSEALQNIYMRGFWINLANQETRIWSGVRGGIVDPNWSEGFIDIAIETRTTNTTFHKMDQFNSQLYQAIASMDDETQLLFATKNVRLYDRDDNNNLVLIGVENTFQTTSRILTEGFINVYMPYPTEVIEDFITSEARFIFDNSHNDLLIVSENLIQFLTNKMDATFSGSESMNLGIFWAGLVVSFLFVVVSVGYIIMINRDYHVFANILLTFPQEDALQTEVILNAFKEMLEKDYEGIDCIEAIEASQMNQQAKVKSMDHSNMVKKGAKAKSSKTGTSHRISIAVLKRKNFFLLLRMLLVVAFIAGALLFYYYWSLDRIKTMQKQQVIINTSLDYINLQSRISAELQSLVQDNDTSYIRNQPLLTSLDNDMERLNEITVLEDSFRDASGELPALQLEILRGYVCDDVSTDLYLLSPGSAEEECADLAAGTNVIGLVEIITKMRFQMTVLLEQFFSSPRTSDDLKVIYLDVINDFIEFLDVSITMFLMSYSLTLIEFQDLVQTLTDNGRILATVGVLISIAIGAWSLFSIILPLMKKEFDKKVVLSMVPTPMILSNRHVKTYVVRNANLKVREAQYLLR